MIKINAAASPTFVKIMKQKSVGEFKPDPKLFSNFAQLRSVVLLCSTYPPGSNMYFCYFDGLIPIDPAIIATGFFLELVYIAIFFAYSPATKRVSNTRSP